MSAAPSLNNNSKDLFSFYQKLGADNSMLDYAKMVILFSHQPQYENLFDKCKIIKEKFREKYTDSDWHVIIYLAYNGSCASSYKSVFISVEYDKYIYIIYNS